MTVPEANVGDRYVAELDEPALSLVVYFNPYQRWTVLILDRKTNCPLLDMHEEHTLARAKHYAEGYVHGACGKLPTEWVAHPKERRNC